MPRISTKTSLFVQTEGALKKLLNLTTTPEFGKGEKASVDITTLEDDAKKYMAGIKEPGDKLSFGFLYDAGEEDSSFDLLKTMDKGTFVLAYPDGTAFSFEAYCDVKIGGAESGGKLSFTLILIPTSLIEEANLAELQPTSYNYPSRGTTEGGED